MYFLIHQEKLRTLATFVGVCCLVGKTCVARLVSGHVRKTSVFLERGSKHILNQTVAWTATAIWGAAPEQWITATHYV